MAEVAQPDRVVIVTVRTYRTKTWMDVLHRLVGERRTGSLKLHMTQGRVEVVDWEERGHGAIAANQ